MKTAQKTLIRKQIVNGTIYYKKQYKVWRKRIFERDRYRCQMPECTKVGGHLNAHHIMMKYEYPEKIYELLNGITLCYNCHQELHETDAEKTYARTFKKIARLNKPRPKIKKIGKVRRTKRAKTRRNTTRS